MEPFPPTGTALQDPNGLLAVGGDLSVERLLEAYRRGIFPWYEADEPILWWTPNPRAVLKPENFHTSKSFRKFLRRTDWLIEVNQQFNNVVDACATLTTEREATWISTPMKVAYQELHRLGYAHSIEVMDQGSLVGGLYGLKLGSIFFGESMFSRTTNSSKFALQQSLTIYNTVLNAYKYKLSEESVNLGLLVRLFFGLYLKILKRKS